MQRIRNTAECLQLTQGNGDMDILRIDRVLNDPDYGDSLGFWLRGSLVNSPDIWHGGVSYQKYGVEGVDNIEDFINYLPNVAGKNQTDRGFTKAGIDVVLPAEPLPADSVFVGEYTVDGQEVVHCIAINLGTIDERQLKRAVDHGDTDQAKILRARIDAGITTRGSYGGSDKVDVESFGYPIGVPDSHTPLFLVNQRRESATMLVDNQHHGIRMPQFAAEGLAKNMAKASTGLKSKSVWG